MERLFIDFSHTKMAEPIDVFSPIYIKFTADQLPLLVITSYYLAISIKPPFSIEIIIFSDWILIFVFIMNTPNTKVNVSFGMVKY